MISGRVTRFTSPSSRSSRSSCSSRSAGSSLPSAAAICALAIAAVCFTGCGDDKKPTEPTPPKRYPAPVSPDSVIAAFEQAYADKNIEEYSTLFDHGLFTFAFAQFDLDQDPGLDPTWGWGPEFESTHALFASTIVYAIRCNLSARDAAVPATIADQLFLSPQDLANTKRVRIREARVEVDTQDSQGGPLTLQVDGDTHEFFIMVYPDELIDGQPRHRIVFWKDKAVPEGGGGGLKEGSDGVRRHAASATQSNTWGRLKQHYF